ncbi:hypothetical protein CKO51_20790 [Rhodopirellula sp. SM50]|nr:hypothetical protein CKO51_20790 [Rhodopirellula sp. SM50]
MEVTCRVVSSETLGRRVTICQSGSSDRKQRPVVFCADGQSTFLFAKEFFCVYPISPVFFIGSEILTYSGLYLRFQSLGDQ